MGKEAKNGGPVNDHFRELLCEGERSEQAKLRIKQILFEYDGTPPALLQAVTDILRLCRDQHTELSEIFSEFYSALNMFRRADVKHLEDAFNWPRPAYWRQNKEAFYEQKGYEVAADVISLLQQGAVTPNVFDTVGAKYNKGAKTIEKIYYRVRHEWMQIKSNYIQAQLKLSAADDRFRALPVAFSPEFLKKNQNK